MDKVLGKDRLLRAERRIFMELEVCHWMVDSVQIVLFGVACGVGTDAVSQEQLTFLRAFLDVESDIRS